MPLLASPVFLASIVVLIVNDHVLKAAWPGWVTGKLSDVAGVVLVALVVRCVVRHDLAAALLVAVAFAWLKVVPGAPDVAAPRLGGPTRTDPTDLLALVALVPVVAWWRTRRGRPNRRGLTPWSVPMVGIAVLATTATSCLPEPSIDRIVVAGSTTWVGMVTTYYEAGGDAVVDGLTWARSDDTGRTWAPADAPTIADETMRRTEACASNGTCWRTVPRQRVESNAGSGWQTAFAFTDDEWEQQRLGTDRCGLEPRDDTFGPLAVLETSDGPVALVAMGPQGVLRYDGRWERIAVLDRVPLAMPGPTWLRSVPTIAIGAVLALVPLAFVGRWRRWFGRPQRRWGQAIGVLAAGVATDGALAFGDLVYPQAYPAWAIISIVTCVAVVLAALVSLVRPLRPLPPPAPRPPVGQA